MTPQEFKVRFPEFALVEDGRIQFLMIDAAAFVDESTWSDLYVRGLSLVIAHFLVLDALRAGGYVNAAMAGNVVAKKVGPVSVAYDAAMNAKIADSPFARTTYGQEYLRLARMVGMGGVSV